jgi:hypothetical protein
LKIPSRVPGVRNPEGRLPMPGHGGERLIVTTRSIGDVPGPDPRA